MALPEVTENHGFFTLPARGDGSRCTIRPDPPAANEETARGAGWRPVLLWRWACLVGWAKARTTCTAARSTACPRGLASAQSTCHSRSRRRGPHRSLPPCGGGTGRGVVRSGKAVPRLHDPHPHPFPARGKGVHCCARLRTNARQRSRSCASFTCQTARQTQRYVPRLGAGAGVGPYSFFFPPPQMRGGGAPRAPCHGFRRGGPGVTGRPRARGLTQSLRGCVGDTLARHAASLRFRVHGGRTKPGSHPGRFTRRPPAVCGLALT